MTGICYVLHARAKGLTPPVVLTVQVLSLLVFQPSSKVGRELDQSEGLVPATVVIESSAYPDPKSSTKGSSGVWVVF